MAVLGSVDVPSATVSALASPRMRDVLEGPGRSARVLHRGRDAVYLEVDGWCLGVVSSRASQVPCALVASADLPLMEVCSAAVGGGLLRLSYRDRPASWLRVGRLVDLSVPRLTPATSYDVPLVLAKPALAELGQSVTGLTELLRSEPERLVGRGSGLTPLGDDVVAGWVATSYALGHPACLGDLRGRTTLLSATLLECATKGEVMAEFRAFVGALAQGDGVTGAATDLVAVGHTSGTGLLLGAYLRLLDTSPASGPWSRRQARERRARPAGHQAPSEGRAAAGPQRSDLGCQA